MMFRTPPPRMIAARQLNETQITLLEAHMALETAQARVDALIARVKRLETYLEAPTEKGIQE